MKKFQTNEYFETYWDMYTRQIPGMDFIYLDGELAKEMKIYEEALKDFADKEESLSKIRAMVAKKLAEKAEAIIREEEKIIRDIEAGKASFGLTTHNQEWSVRREYYWRYEFNVYQLLKFKAQYNI